MQTLKIPPDDQTIPESLTMFTNCVSDFDLTEMFPPEERLFAAMYIHAIRDLMGNERENRKDAYKWLTAWETSLPEAISYRDVCEAVEVIGGYRDWTARFIHEVWTK